MEAKVNKLESEKNQFPQQILTKLKQMDNHLCDIVNKNRRLTDTVQRLMDERNGLQCRIQDLKQICCDREEKANMFAQKYVRTKNFRQALIHQKHYLMLKLNSYKYVERRILTTFDKNVECRRKIPSFKTIAMAFVAISRMKILLRTTEK